MSGYRSRAYDIATMTQPTPDRTTPPPDDTRRRRLVFRANHRGTHETDLLVGGFITPRIAQFTPTELDALEAILELPDVDLADWLSGRRPIPPEHDTPLLQAMRQAAGA